MQKYHKSVAADYSSAEPIFDEEILPDGRVIRVLRGKARAAPVDSTLAPPARHTTPAAPRASVNAVANMITGQRTLKLALNRRGDEVVKVENKATGYRGISRTRVVDVLKKQDRPDARPAGVCKECFTAWLHSVRPRLIVCQHKSVAAYRRGGSWAVTTLTAGQLSQLSAPKAPA